MLSRFPFALGPCPDFDEVGVARASELFKALSGGVDTATDDGFSSQYLAYCSGVKIFFFVFMGDGVLIKVQILSVSRFVFMQIIEFTIVHSY